MAFEGTENGSSFRMDLSRTRIEGDSLNPFEAGYKDVAVLLRFGGAIGQNVEVWHYATWYDSNVEYPRWEVTGALRGMEVKYYNDNINNAQIFPEDIPVAGIKGQAYPILWMPIAGS